MSEAGIFLTKNANVANLCASRREKRLRSII